MTKGSRKKARRYALQALYSWDMTQNPVNDIELYMLSEHGQDNFDKEYFKILLQAVPRSVEQLDAILTPSLDRPLQDLDYIERAVLRMATLELRDHLDIPYRVVINEALELTKAFGATDSYKFVNGVLDKVARQLRGVEMSQ